MENASKDLYPPGGRFMPYLGLKRVLLKRYNQREKETVDPSHEEGDSSASESDVENINNPDEESESSSNFGGRDAELSDSITMSECPENENFSAEMDRHELSKPTVEKSVESPPNEQVTSAAGSLRRVSSCDSELSTTSNSIRSASKCENETKENTDHDDSPSPLPTRKKRKRDMFQDTDSEEEHQSNDVACPFKRQTCVLGDEEDKECAKPSTSRAINQRALSDFEIMMQRKRAEKQKKQKPDMGFITTNDELIAQLIDQMDDAAYEDRQLNKRGLPAIKKVSLLNYVLSQLRKKDLQATFLEQNVLSTLTEWLSPLPSKCLPCLQIRDSILRLLDDFPLIDLGLVEESGIGKALMFLRKHPDETKKNKERCNYLIAKLARPLKYEREATMKPARQLPELKQNTTKSVEPPQPKKIKCGVDITLVGKSTTEAKRPGDPGWTPRARVPQPSMRDYINRPESKIQCEFSARVKPNRFELLYKKHQKVQRNKNKRYRGNKLSIVGEKI